MSGSASDILTQARQLLATRGMPITTANLNNASLAISQNMGDDAAGNALPALDQIMAQEPSVPNTFNSSTSQPTSNPARPSAIATQTAAAQPATAPPVSADPQANSAPTPPQARNPRAMPTGSTELPLPPPMPRAIDAMIPEEVEEVPLDDAMPAEEVTEMSPPAASMYPNMGQLLGALPLGMAPMQGQQLQPLIDTLLGRQRATAPR